MTDTVNTPITQHPNPSPHPDTDAAHRSDARPAEPAPAAGHTWGDPFPLGLASFGISALVLATLQTGFIDAGAAPGVLALALAVGFLTELVAGIIHFQRGETFPALVFTAYAGFWLSYALLVQVYVPTITAAATDIVGMFLLAWAIFSTYMLLAAVRTNLTTVVIFALLCVVFYSASFGSFLINTGLTQFSGYVLLVDAAVALYASAAIIVNTTWERTVLPVP